MDAGSPEPAEILGETIVADDEVRRALHIEIDRETMTFIERRLEAGREPIARFFELSLGEREGVSFLRYAAGGFFKPHRDWARVKSWPGAARRRIALVIFLGSSREVNPAGCFSGGILRLFADDHAECDVPPRAGTLVAFPATRLHEVTPVRDGIRDSIVDWYF